MLNQAAVAASSPTFLVGCGRSGTNMVSGNLAKSPEIKLFNEDNPAAFTKYRLRDERTIQRLIDRSNSPVVLFKPILDTHITARWLELFPNTKILFLIRHFYDVVNSSLRRFGPERWTKSVGGWIRSDFEEMPPPLPPESTRDIVRALWRPDLDPASSSALRWLFFNQLYYDLELHLLSTTRLISYEKIVTHPDNEMADICRFLSIDYSSVMADGIISSSIRRDPRPLIDEAILNECNALWRRLARSAGVEPNWGDQSMLALYVLHS